MECLIRQAGSGDVEPQVARALLRLLSLFPIGSYVLLSDGSIARVLRRNGDHYTQPIVRLVQDSNGTRLPLGSEAAVIDLNEEGLRVSQALRTPSRDEIGLSDEILEIRRSRPPMESAAGVQGLFPADPTESFSAPTGIRTVFDPQWDVQGHATLETYTDKQKRAVWRAIELADRCNARTEQGFTQRRKHKRVAVRTVVNVRLLNSRDAPFDVGGGERFRALARDVSQGGLSFLHPELLKTKHILIGVDIPDGGRRWFESEIVRCREIDTEGFWEYGVAFRRRLKS
jgi:hypothetical protein